MATTRDPKLTAAKAAAEKAAQTKKAAPKAAQKKRAAPKAAAAKAAPKAAAAKAAPTDDWHDAHAALAADLAALGKRVDTLIDVLDGKATDRTVNELRDELREAVEKMNMVTAEHVNLGETIAAALEQVAEGEEGDEGDTRPFVADGKRKEAAGPPCAICQRTRIHPQTGLTCPFCKAR